MKAVIDAPLGCVKITAIIALILKGSIPMYAENEIMFPHHLIPSLETARGAQWDALIERVCAHSEYHEASLAFVLTMIRLNGCLGCETDSFRAMRGCEACALQTLRRFKGSDADLMTSAGRCSSVRGYAHAHGHYRRVKSALQHAPTRLSQTCVRAAQPCVCLITHDILRRIL